MYIVFANDFSEVDYVISYFTYIHYCMRFEDTFVYLSVRSDDAVSKADLKLKLLSLGANISLDLSGANFVVYHFGSKQTVEKANERNIPVVRPNWVNVSYAERAFVPIGLYLYSSTQKVDAVFIPESDLNITTDGMNKIDSSSYNKEKCRFQSIPKESGHEHETTKSTSLEESKSNNLILIKEEVHAQSGDLKSHEQPKASSTQQEMYAHMVILITGSHKEFLINIVHALGAKYVENALSLIATGVNDAEAFNIYVQSREGEFLDPKQEITPYDESFLQDESNSSFPAASQASQAGREMAYCILVDTDAEAASENSIEVRTLKHIFSFAFTGVPTVHPSWLYQCLDMKKWMTTKPHLTSQYRKHLKRRELASRNSLKGASFLPRAIPIFKNLHFYLSGKFESPTKEELTFFIKSLGGTIERIKHIKRKSHETHCEDANDVPCVDMKVFSVHATEEVPSNTALYAPIHQSVIFDSIEQCTCTFFINKFARE